MEGVSFADAEHSTPVSLKPPTQLSTPTPGRRQSRKTVPSSTTKRGEGIKRGTPVGAGVKKNGVAPRSGRPVKSLPGHRKGKGLGSIATMVHFLDAENKMLKEMVADQLPGDLESLKLLLNEALDLRYSQEIQLEHERTPGLYIPVLDAIDYRGLLERLTAANDRQNIRAIVYSKIEGVPVTPVRRLYTPARPAVVSLPTLTTPARVVANASTPVTNPSIPALSTPQAAAATPTPAIPSSSTKKKISSTPKSVRIELPAPASEIRKPSVPKKSSLSISVTAEDVTVASLPAEDVVTPSPVPVPSTSEPEKTSAKKDKKRKREAEQEEETGATTVDSVVPIKEKASKKRKVAKDAAVPVGEEQGETTLDDGVASVEQKVNARRERRLQKQEEARKAAKLAAEEQQNVKLAQTLVPAPAPAPAVATTTPVSESGGDGQKSLSKRELRKLAAKRVKERSMRETSDATVSEDVEMDDSAHEDVESRAEVVSAPMETVGKVAEVITPPKLAEPVVAPTATGNELIEPSQAVSTEPESKRKTKRRKGEKRDAAGLTMDQSGEGLNAPSPGASGESASAAAPEKAIVPENQPSAAVSDQVSTTQESKSTRRNNRRKPGVEEARKSTTPTGEATPAGSAITEAHAGDKSVAVALDVPVAAAGDVSVTVAPSTDTKADTPSAPKTSKRKVKQSSAAAALAEWRAKHPESSNTVVASSPPTATSQVTPSPVIAQTTLPPVEATSQPEAAPAAEPMQSKTTADTDKPIVDDQSEEESEPSTTPPASSAQIPLPPASQQIARLPSSSPESYPSDSEESQDAWQKAHRRMRTPGSDDLEPEGDEDEDDDDEREQDAGRKDGDMVDDIEEPVRVRDTPEAIASFGEPEAQVLPMEVDAVEEVEQSTGESTPRLTSSPTPQPIPASAEKEEEEVAPEPQAVQPEVDTPEATPQPGTPNLFSSTQDPLVPPTQSHHRPAPLTLTDLAAPPSPLMPSTGVVAFQDAMEEDAVADQVAMDGISADENTNAIATVVTQDASDVTQSGTDSGTSQSISQSQTSTASPRRLRSRMRMRDGSKPETDPVRPLPLPAATPKKRGRQPKAQSQADPVVQVSVTSVPVAPVLPVISTVNGVSETEADSPAPTMSRKERRIAASQSRIPALSSLSADALRKGRASRFSTTSSALPMNGTMSQPNRLLAPNTQSGATSNTDEDDNQETDSGSDSEDEHKDVASSLPVGLANRVAGAAPSQKSRQSLGAMKGW